MDLLALRHFQSPGRPSSDFDRSGRHPAEEAMRYAIVAGAAQAMSYAVFALLVLTVPAAPPQLALLVGAASGAVVSYAGQSLFAFRPRRPGGNAA